MRSVEGARAGSLKEALMAHPWVGDYLRPDCAVHQTKLSR
jgi:hypothetical protein